MREDKNLENYLLKWFESIHAQEALYRNEAKQEVLALENIEK